LTNKNTRSRAYKLFKKQTRGGGGDQRRNEKPTRAKNSTRGKRRLGGGTTEGTVKGDLPIFSSGGGKGWAYRKTPHGGLCIAKATSQTKAKGGKKGKKLSIVNTKEEHLMGWPLRERGKEGSWGGKRNRCREVGYGGEPKNQKKQYRKKGN